MTGDKLRSPMDPLNIFKQWWGEPLSEELYKRTITAPIEQQYEFLEFAENAPTADIPDLERGMLRPLLINDGFNFVDLDDYFSAASTLALYTDEVAIEYTFGAGPLDLKIMLQYLLKIKPLAEDGAVRFFKAHLHMHTESEAYKTWEQFQDVLELDDSEVEQFLEAVSTFYAPSGLNLSADTVQFLVATQLLTKSTIPNKINLLGRNEPELILLNTFAKLSQLGPIDRRVTI